MYEKACLVFSGYCQFGTKIKQCLFIGASAVIIVNFPNDTLPGMSLAPAYFYAPVVVVSYDVGMAILNSINTPSSNGSEAEGLVVQPEIPHPSGSLFITETWSNSLLPPPPPPPPSTPSPSDDFSPSSTPSKSASPLFGPSLLLLLFLAMTPLFHLRSRSALFLLLALAFLSLSVPHLTSAAPLIQIEANALQSLCENLILPITNETLWNCSDAINACDGSWSGITCDFPGYLGVTIEYMCASL